VSIAKQERAVLRRLASLSPALAADLPELANLSERERAALIESLVEKDLATEDGDRLQITTLGLMESQQD